MTCFRRRHCGSPSALRDDHLSLSSNYNNMANTYDSLGNYDQALECHEGQGCFCQRQETPQPVQQLGAGESPAPHLRRCATRHFLPQFVFIFRDAEHGGSGRRFRPMAAVEPSEIPMKTTGAFAPQSARLENKRGLRRTRGSGGRCHCPPTPFPE